MVTLINLKTLPIILATLFVTCGHALSCTVRDNNPLPVQQITVTSPTFASGGKIPDKYSCWGGNASPQVDWTPGPANTASYVLLVEDTNTEGKPFSHWVLYNIRQDITSLHEGISTNGILDTGAIQGRNDRMKLGYFGPCPPAGETHQYRFTVYAIDTTIGLAAANREQVLQAIEGRILAIGHLDGIYRQ